MWKPMLASNAKIEDLKLPTYVSTKLEGVRGEFTPEGLITRSGKPFNNKLLAKKFSKVLVYCRYNNVIIEGEFYKHGKGFRELGSICRRANHPDTEELEFHVFDIYAYDNPTLTFNYRYNIYTRTVSVIAHKDVRPVPQEFLGSHELIHKVYEDVLTDGFEGLCFKSPAAGYKTGRSTKNEQIFSRIKPEDTYDGVVIEIIERMENLCKSEENELGYLRKKQNKDMKAHTGLAAVAIVKSPDFDKEVRVSLTRGIKDHEQTKDSPSRESIWANREHYIGKHIRFVGIPVPGMDLPRSPRFDAWRLDLD